MRILFDHSAFVEWRYGGVSRYFSELIPRVAQKTPVELFMGLHINRYGLDRHRQAMARFAGCRRPFIRKTHRAAMFLSNQWFQRFTRRSHADIYHTTYEAMLWPDFRGRRVITIHDLTPEKFPQFFACSSASLAHKRTLAQRADGIICVSENTRRDVIELLNVPPEKTCVVYHGNCLNMQVTEPRAVVEPYLLYVGMRRGYKNFIRLVEAYASDPRIHREFSLICFGGGSLTPDEVQRIQSLGVAGRIRQFGGPDTLLANLYTHATAFIYPSLYEGFGIPLLEAMHYNCPIIASRASCFPEIAGDAAVYFDPDNTDDIVRQIVTVIGDGPKRAEMVEMGRIQGTKYSWDRCAAETVNYYRVLLS
ncbi:MAG: glycosyltransferase family 1 protein [Phycisphaeraceae bacterium]